MTINSPNAIAAFFGGWCGSVPISYIIWLIIHGRHPGPPPPPDPWWRISIVAAVVGCLAGTILVSSLNEPLTSMSVLASAAIGYAAGSIAGGIVGRSSLSR
jgi:hypothetical protein